MTELEALSDHFIVAMYEAIRKEVMADASSGTRFVGLPGKRRAEELRQEIDRRGLFCAEMDWPEHLKDAEGDTCELIAGHRKMT
jgi:hypothetical protein